MADEPFQASYRRHRPRRFSEIRGQDHITTALRNAVGSDRVAHAYLFSGPRGTGKTSTARILAAALNCAKPADGEPDGTCESCVAIRAGTSLDVMELDAASNNGVDAMRDLVTRAALGSPGRWKVYIVDEVHMLTAGASNALLKTLEEPPGHVIFVLATTDDQKVLPTIRSRTQHFHFRLLAPEILTSLLADVSEQDGLGLDAATLDHVVRKGNGSARDALSALDQAVAAGEAEDEGQVVPAIVEAMIAHDAAAALVAVADAIRRGRDPHRVAIEIIQHLRGGFLLAMAPDVADVPQHEREALLDQARRLGTPATVRAMEVLGETLVDMRESLDTRVSLEMALVRLSAPAADTTPAAMLERLEALERRAGRTSQPEAPRSPQTREPTPPPPPSRERPTPPQVAGARPTIGALRQKNVTEAAAATAETGTQAATEVRTEAPTEAGTETATPPEAETAAPPVDRDELTKLWGDKVFSTLSARARAAFRPGRWLRVEGATALFSLPQELFRPAEDNRDEVEGALAVVLGGRLRIQLQPEGAPPAEAAKRKPEEPDAEVTAAEFADLPVAPAPALSAEARLLEAFPGTEEITS